MSQDKKYYMNAFFLYCQDKIKEFEKENDKNKSKRSISSKVLGKRWNAIKHTEQGKKYIDKGKENRENWNKGREERLKRSKREKKEAKKKMKKEKKSKKKMMKKSPGWMKRRSNQKKK